MRKLIVCALFWSLIFFNGHDEANAAFAQDRTPPGQADQVWQIVGVSNEATGAWSGTASFEQGTPWTVKLVIFFIRETGTYRALSFDPAIEFMPSPNNSLTVGEDNDVSFQLLSGTPLQTEYKGKISGHTIKGTLYSPTKGLTGSFELTRLRQPLSN